jgi:GNAT superfamily N-acetyltransferase
LVHVTICGCCHGHGSHPNQIDCPPSWELRAASAGDVEPLANLRVAVLRDDLSRLGRFNEVRVRQRFRDGFEAAHTWGIHIDGRLNGCVAMRPDYGAVWLEHFYIHPDHQGRGIGGEVLRAILDQFGSASPPVRLNVLQGSTARSLYERHGFITDSEDSVDVFMTHQLGGFSRSCPS